MHERVERRSEWPPDGRLFIVEIREVVKLGEHIRAPEIAPERARRLVGKVKVHLFRMHLGGLVVRAILALVSTSPKEGRFAKYSHVSLARFAVPSLNILET